MWHVKISELVTLNWKTGLQYTIAYTSFFTFDLDLVMPSTIPSKSCDRRTCKVWSNYAEWLRRRCVYKKNAIYYIYFELWPLTLSFDRGPTKHCPVPSTSCDHCTCKVWSCYVQRLRRRCIYKKIRYLTLTFRTMSHKTLPSILYIMWTMHLQSLKWPQQRF